MNDLLIALCASLADSGPVWVIAFASIVLFSVKIWPYIVQIGNRREDREDKRDQRQAQYQKESAERDGKWLVVSEQSAKALEAVSKQMEINNAMLRDSKARSQRMGSDMSEVRYKSDRIADDIQEVKSEVHAIYNNVVKSNEQL